MFDVYYKNSCKIKYVLVGILQIPDVDLYLSNLTDSELFYLRRLYNRRDFSGLENFIRLTSDRMVGFWKGYIEFILGRSYSPSQHKPISKTYIRDCIFTIRFIQKRAISTDDIYFSKTCISDVEGIKNYIFSTIIPGYLKFNRYDGYDGLKTWIGLYWIIRKNNTT